MEQYISKSALVAEIERKADIICQGVLSEEATMSVEYFKDSLISFLDTLEVKEMDLENELKEDWLFADKTEVDFLECMCLTEDMFVSLAKKYFKLGLKAIKGE